jgi:hypothetical protein
MNYSSLALAALGGTVASFGYGFLLMWLLPAVFEAPLKYPGVFRAKEQMMSVAPVGFGSSIVAIVVVTIIFAMTHRSGAMEGARLGVLIGIFAICNVAHNYMNLNINFNFSLQQAAIYFVQWLITCIVIGLIYNPPAAT